MRVCLHRKDGQTVWSNKLHKDFQFVGGLTPAISAAGTSPNARGAVPQHYKFQFNFGERPFANPNLPTGYRSIHDWLRGEQARLRVLAGVNSSPDAAVDTAAGETKTTSTHNQTRSEWAVQRISESSNLELIASLIGIDTAGSKEAQAFAVAQYLGLCGQ